MITALKKAMNVPPLTPSCTMMLRPYHSSSASNTTPSASISGEEIACTATERMFAVLSLSDARRKRLISQCSVPNAFTMPWPEIVSCTMFWISASLSCPRRVVVRTLRPTLRDDSTTTGTNSSSTSAIVPPVTATTTIITSKVKNCCGKSLSTVAIAFCTRSTSLISVEISVPDVCR